MYSLKAMEGRHKGRVVAYAAAITVNDPKFVVSGAGLKRAHREKQRNVHAGVIGKVVAISEHINRLSHTIPQKRSIRRKHGTAVTYNPWKYDSFVTRKTEKPVYNAKRAHFYHRDLDVVF